MTDSADVESSRRERRYRTFFELTTEGVWCVELTVPLPTQLDEDAQVAHIYAHARFVECNVAMAHMYGLDDPTQLIGSPVRDVLVETEPANTAMLREFIRSGYRLLDALSCERDREGRPRWFLNNFVGVLRDGAVVEAWGNQRDVTAMKQLEEQLLRAQKMEAIGRLAGGVAHDFNNLLAIILAAGEMARRGVEEGTRARTDLDDLLSAARKAADLTRKLLTLAHVERPQTAPFDPAAHVEELRPMLQRVLPASVDLIVAVPEHVGWVLADRGQLDQVLLNLVLNARDAMPDGGVLSIGAHDVDDRVVLTVTDTGSGMPPEVQAHIFEPFFTTKEPGKGTGLGLATAYTLIRGVGGDIEVQSAVGAGTTFRVALPRAAAPAHS